MRAIRMSGSMSGVWKRSQVRTSKAPPDERGGKQICSGYRYRATPRLYHEDQFRPPSLSGRCRLGEATFAGMGDKEEGAPIPVVGRRKLTGQDRPKSTSAGYVRTKMIRMCLESSGSWRKLHSHYRAAGVDPSGHPLRVAASATRDVIFSLQDRGKQDPSLGLGAVRSARAKNIGHELFLGSG